MIIYIFKKNLKFQKEIKSYEITKDINCNLYVSLDVVVETKTIKKVKMTRTNVVMESQNLIKI